MDIRVIWKLFTLMIDEEVDKFRFLRLVIKFGERVGVGRVIGVDIGLIGRKGLNK